MAADPWFRPLSRLGIALATAVVLMVLVSLLVWIAGGSRTMPVSFARTPLGVLGLVLSPICYAAVGGILAGFVPRNPVGWLLLAASMLIGVALPANLIVASAHESLQRPPDLVVWMAWTRTAFVSPGMAMVLILASMLFPDGRMLGRRWWIAAGLTVVGGGLLAIATAVDPRSLRSYPTFPNPMALPYALDPAVGAVRLLAIALLVGCGVVAVGSLWVRHRRGDALVRAQLRWILVAAAVGGIAAMPYLLARNVLEVDETTGELASTIALIGSCAMPVAAAFAISRYRLFDVDALIGRTLVYLPLMGILSGLYTAGVALFQRLFVALTGETSDLAVALTLLLVASAFTPVRKRLETAVDRRFPAGPGAEPATVGMGVPAAAIVPIDDAGVVACPRGGSKSVRECLACPSLRATVPGPNPSIVCELAAAGR